MNSKEDGKDGVDFDENCDINMEVFFSYPAPPPPSMLQEGLARVKSRHRFVLQRWLNVDLEMSFQSLKQGQGSSSTSSEGQETATTAIVTDGLEVQQTSANLNGNVPQGTGNKPLDNPISLDKKAAASSKIKTTARDYKGECTK